MNDRTIRSILLAPFCALLAASVLHAQCPPDEQFEYTFCKDGKLVQRCTGDPYHVFEDGQKLKPFKRYNPACMSILQPARLDIYMPAVVTGGGPDDYVPVFLVSQQTKDIVDGFNQWSDLCPPSTGPFDCCMQIVFSSDVNDFSRPDGVYGFIDQVDLSACRPSCTDSHIMYINDTDDWLYGKHNPELGDEIVRSFYTGRFPPSIAPGYEAYSLFQAIESATADWYGLADEPDASCHHDGTVVGIDRQPGPPVDLTPEDICQFKKLYCDHEVGLGVDDTQEPSLFFDIAPNPANGMITLRLPEDLPYDPLTLRLVDASGATVRKVDLKEPAREIEVDVSALSNGVYMFTLSNGTYCHGEKVIVRH